MKLLEIMRKLVVTVAPGLPLSEALARLRAAGVGHSVVLAGRVVVGVVSVRDLLCVRGDARASRVVADVMSPHLVPGTPETTLRQAAILMRVHGVGCLPVLDRGGVVGIVTRSVLLAALAADRREGRRLLHPAGVRSASRVAAAPARTRPASGSRPRASSRLSGHTARSRSASRRR